MLAVTAALAACSPSTNSSPTESASSSSPTGIDRVVLIGDSLGEQVAPYLQLLTGTRSFEAQVFGGTAPCDWLGKDLKVTASSVAVITFIGNSSTTCMADSAGGYLHGQSLVDKYRSDITALVAQARGTGAQVLLVGQPQRVGADADTEVAGINSTLADLVVPGEVSFVDAGASVEDPAGGFALRLPCMPGEAQCDPDGSIQVRSEDGVHFCSGFTATGCAEYSSGAFRFAAALAKAIDSLTSSPNT